MSVPTGGILAAESISKAIGDLMKGMFGVEQATPDIQGKIAQQGQAQRQEMLSMAQLPMQLEQEKAKLGLTGAQTQHLGAQSENQLAQADLHRAQTGAIPSTMLLSRMRALAQEAQAGEHNAKIKQMADAEERRNEMGALIDKLDPKDKDYALKLSQIFAKYDPHAPGLAKLAETDPLIESKKASYEALVRQRDAVAKSHDPSDPLYKKRLEGLDALIRLHKAQADKAVRDKTASGKDLTAYQEQQAYHTAYQDAGATLKLAFQDETGKTNFSTIPGTTTEKIAAMDWLRRDHLNEILKQRKLDKFVADIGPAPKNLEKWLKEQKGEGSSWFSSWGDRFKSGTWGVKMPSELNPQSITMPESEEGDEEGNSGWGEVTVK